MRFQNYFSTITTENGFVGFSRKTNNSIFGVGCWIFQQPTSKMDLLDFREKPTIPFLELDVGNSNNQLRKWICWIFDGFQLFLDSGIIGFSQVGLLDLLDVGFQQPTIPTIQPALVYSLY